MTKVTTTAIPVKYKSEVSRQFNHVEWLELYGDGLLHECVIMNRDQRGNVFFFKTNDLDMIDKRRIAGFLTDRNAGRFRLTDLMSQRTLGNGINALAYFHQLVRQLTPEGKIVDPKTGQMGGGVVSINPQ